MKTFVPFHEINRKSVIVVDGLHPQNLTLSHWKGANKLKSIAADTSGEIVINAIEKSYSGIEIEMVSATHFDIDGFVGVFALFYPELALQFKNELIAMARIGDFRDLRSNSEIDELALKLCCWMNKVEKEQFYRPFEEKDELKVCHHKFNYFIPLFPDALTQIEHYEPVWKEEYEDVQKGLAQIENEERIDHLGLVIRTCSSPIHYYALFSETEGFDMILSMYPQNRYELEYKYTTWVDIVSRPTLPRIDLKPLADELNQIEASSYDWTVDSITDTGPILRLENKLLSKADRYANPTEREIYRSSIQPEKFKNILVSFFEKSYHNIPKKKGWTWEEMKQIEPVKNLK